MTVSDLLERLKQLPDGLRDYSIMSPDTEGIFGGNISIEFDHEDKEIFISSEY